MLGSASKRTPTTGFGTSSSADTRRERERSAVLRVQVVWATGAGTLHDRETFSQLLQQRGRVARRRMHRSRQQHDIRIER
jgi:hypothetical protein